MNAPIIPLVPLTSDLSARVDRETRPVRVVLERHGKQVASMPWNSWCLAHGVLQRQLQAIATPRPESDSGQGGQVLG